ncbi:hypothetical protein LBMAG42_35060 [Deltaproteobacteria bacterium]|nr:hypothetical protein LBMAG42_35060 [Deltaproteobacteria bacterium]
MSLLLLLLACPVAEDPAKDTDSAGDSAADTSADTGGDTAADTSGDTGEDTAEETGADTAWETGEDSAGETGIVGDEDGDGYRPADGDCNDGDPAVNPDAVEVCNGLDDNCDGEVDEDVVGLWYADGDGDGAGDASASVSACEAPAGYVATAGDCDDTDPALGAPSTEVCNGVDDDCDGVVDWDQGVPANYATIQAAIDDLASGDTVCVSAGTYSERLDFNGKNLVVEGWEGAEVTILDGDGAGPVVTFSKGEGAAATLRGFTVTGGEAEDGAGIFVSGADPTLESLIVSGNACSGAYYYCSGTGVYLYDSSPTLSSVVIEDNQQSWPGSGGLAYGWGVGLFVTGGSPVFIDVDLRDNVHYAIATISYVTAYGVGGYLTNTDLMWSGGTISGNTFTSSASVVRPGATGGGLMVTGGGTLSLNNVVIADNAIDGYTATGGGLSLSAVTASLTNVIVAQNTTTADSQASGGGLAIGYADATLLNVDIVANAADAPTCSGGGIYLSNSGTTTLNNVSLVGNTSTGTGAAIASGAGPAFASTYSNYYDHGSSVFDGVSDPVGVDGNIEVDAGYTDTSAAAAVDWDLSLSAGSALLDVGDPSIADIDGTTSDIGAWGGPGAADW